MLPAASSVSSSRPILWRTTLVLSFKDRIELLEADLKAEPPAFIMSRDLPFAIFRYDPNSGSEREWEVRRQIQQLKVRVENTTRHKIQTLSLADFFWESVRESEGVEVVVEL